MAGVWKFFVEEQRWNATKQLYITHHLPRGRGDGQRSVARIELVNLDIGPAGPLDQATLSQTREDALDNIPDVDGFLQAAIDAAWEMGMRPKGFADHTSELKATRYHLEDMRVLAKVVKP